jgi:histidinol-phosphate aminotransferase
VSGLPPVSERIRALVGYVPGEQPTDTRLIKLNTNENPYPPSPRVRAALRAAAEGALNRYPSPSGDALRKCAARVYGLAENQVLAGNGSDELLAICLRATVTEGAAVAYATPSYSLYRTLAALTGAAPIEVEIDAATESGTCPIPGGLVQAPAVVKFVCHPNSPFGVPVDLGRIAEICTNSRGLVVSDEAYVDFGAESALRLLPSHPNLVVLRSFSKSFSLAGLRLGLAFGAPELIRELAKVKDSYNVSRLALAAGVAALEDLEWMRSNVERIRATRERVVRTVRSRGYRVPDSAANFFWLDCAARGGRDVYEQLRRAGVLVRYFDQDRLRSGVRVTVGTDSEMDAFLAALP